MELMKVLSNPVRMQVMQYLQTHGEATTKQISEAVTDVPAPTLYRHINTLLKEEILFVRGTKSAGELGKTACNQCGKNGRNGK